MNIIILYIEPQVTVPEGFNMDGNFKLPASKDKVTLKFLWFDFDQNIDPIEEDLIKDLSPLILDNVETVIFYHTGSKMDYTNFIAKKYKENETLKLIPFSNNKGPVYDLINTSGTLLQKLKKRDELELWNNELLEKLNELILYAEKGRLYNETFNDALKVIVNFNQSYG